VVFLAGLTGLLTQWRGAANNSEENRRQVAQLNVLSGVQLLQAGDYFKSLLWFAEALRTDAGHSEREAIHRSRIASVLQQCPRLLQVISHHGQPMAGAAFGPNDDRLATVSVDDRIVRTWAVPSGKLLMKTKRLTAVPYSVLFSPDGSRLLVVLSDNTARPVQCGWFTALHPNGRPSQFRLGHGDGRPAAVSGQRT
jgi:WD40 repeat protein